MCSKEVRSITVILFLFVQDKALAALAIEDKKRQYAAAEKYLEDVLQSALATSDWLAYNRIYFLLNNVLIFY